MLSFRVRNNRFLALLFVASGCAPFISQGAPTGACSCDGGKAAVEGSHLTANAVTGSLADGGFDLVANGQYKLDPSILTSVEVGKSPTLSIQGGPFRGILIRMGAEGLTMTPAANFQLASACMEPNVAGITHTENSPKSGLTSIGNFRVSSAQALDVDVTVVVSNNANDGSVYYYNSYLLKAVGELPNAPRPDTISPQSAELEGPALELNPLSETMAALPAECTTLSPISAEATLSPATDPPTPMVTLLPTTTPTITSSSPSVRTGTLSPSVAPTIVSSSPSLPPTSYSTNAPSTFFPSLSLSFSSLPTTSLPTRAEPMTSNMPSSLPLSEESIPAVSTIGHDQQSKSPLSSGVIIAIVSAGAFVVCVLAGTFLYYQKLKTKRETIQASASSSDAQVTLPSYTVEAELATEVPVCDVVDVLPETVLSAAAPSTTPITMATTTSSGGNRRPRSNNGNHRDVASSESTIPLPEYKDQVHSIAKVESSAEDCPVVAAKVADRSQDIHEPDRKPRHLYEP